MSRRLFVGALVAALAALALVSTSFAGQQTGAQQADSALSLNFTVVERALTDVVIDLGTPGDSIGDTLAFGNPVFDASNVTRIGRDQGSCVRTNVGKFWECSWTNLLPGGHLTVQGPFNDDGTDSILSVTGGTGKYKDVDGVMVLHWRNAGGTEFDFIFKLAN